MLTISTQAARDTMPLSQLIDYGCKVQAGEIKDKTFAMTFLAAPEDADIFDPKVWKACNPALGKFLSMEDFRSQAEMVKNSPSMEPAFRNLRLNQRCEQVARFVPRRLWDACAGVVEDCDLSGDCYAGLDLSGSRDLSSFVIWWPECGAVRVYAWLPAATLEDRAKEDGAPYVEWARAGALLKCDGKTIDYRAVAGIVAEACDKYGVRAVAFDRWKMPAFSRAMSDTYGLDCETDLHFQPWGQGFRDMAPAVDAFERALLDGRFRHGGQPVLRMCAANAVTVTDPAGNRKLTKEKSRGRIDCLQALCMACGIAERYEKKNVTITAEDAKGMVMSF